MEDALVLTCFFILSEECHISLNPCCNGRCTRTIYKDMKATKLLKVLILVVMEDALVRNNEKVYDNEHES